MCGVCSPALIKMLIFQSDHSLASSEKNDRHDVDLHSDADSISLSNLSLADYSQEIDDFRQSHSGSNF
jgi:hypothetical protein